MEDKLKSVCKNCSAATIKNYKRGIIRLYKLTHTAEDVKLNHAWLNDTLIKKLKDVPLNKRRHLSIAAVKFLQAIKGPKKKLETFTELMIDDSVKYKEQRGTNQWSEKEKAKRPEKGMKDIKKGATELHTKVKRLIKNDKEPNMKTLFKYQAFILLKLYQELPLRNTYATLDLVDKKTNNYIKTGQR